MLTARFGSLSMISPQLGQMWVRTDRLFHTRKPQQLAILRGIGGRDSHYWDVADAPVVADPREEESPTGVVHALGEVMVFDHVLDV
jgi:hypothetical protein